MLEQVGGKELREVAARCFTGQANEEDTRRWNEEVWPLVMYPPKPELMATSSSRMIQNEEIRDYMWERFENEYDVRPHLAGIMIPTLVLHGRYDWIMSLREADELAQSIPHAHLYIFEQAGHAIQDDLPEELIQVIRTFLGDSLPNELLPFSSE